MTSRIKFRKYLLLGLILCVAILGGGYVAYKGYRSVRQARLVEKARAYMAQQKDRNALLCLQRAMRYNNQDLDALRLIAELCERMRIPSAILFRDRIVDLNPGSTEDRLALAQTALVFRDYATATNALAGIDAAGRETAPYHNLAGAIAASIKDLAQAEAHFAAAVRLEPANAAPQMNLAVVRLQGTNEAAHVQARAVLDLLAVNPTNAALRCQALRELTKDAVRNAPDRALAFAERLIQETNSVFTDYLLKLGILKSTTNQAFGATLALCQREAGEDPAKIYELTQWQLANVPHQATLAWLQSLPEDVRTNQPTAWLIANCHALLRDWGAAHQALQKQYWAELEFLRHGLMSRALEGQQLVAASKGEWELALKAAENRKGSCVMLLKLAAQWGRRSEFEELLWIIVKRYPDERWATQELMDALYAAGRTRSLLQLFTLENQRRPDSLPILNNLAMMALLLNATELKPYEVARQVYERAPTNAEYASTHAFSLYLQQQHSEALKIMESLDRQHLEQPAIAGYYGLILKAAGKKEQARSFIEAGFRARLLPEERKMLEQARADS